MHLDSVNGQINKEHALMKHKNQNALLFLALVVSLTLAIAVFPVLASPDDDAILYAAPTPSGSGNCSSWPDACSLQTALTNAVGTDQIWVQMGVYKPTTTTDRTLSFVLKDGVALYGGFNGTETALEQRNWETNITVLSGDIDNNDVTNANGVVTNPANIMGSNAYHVVSSTGVLSNAILDGFTITGGQANDSAFPNDSGGGMFNSNSSPMLMNLTLRGNTAHGVSSYAGGGGMYNTNSHPTLINTIFQNNSVSEALSAVYSGGGGMYNTNSNPTLLSVTFSNNTANGSSIDGGGVFNEHSNPMLMDVTFSGNSAGGRGGGMHNTNSSPALNGGTFSNNVSDDGGGMHNIFSSPTLTNVTFTSNIANTTGGGISNYTDSNPTLTNVTIGGNVATLGRAGGMYNNGSSPTLMNVMINNNSATNVLNNGSGGGIYNNFNSHPALINVIIRNNSARYGGGIYNNNTSNPVLVNVTFHANLGSLSGGGIYNGGNSTPTLLNSILWGNNASSGSQIFKASGTPLISYSDIQGSGGSGTGWNASLGTDGGGNIDTDPLFVNTASEDLHLGINSPAIDAGNNVGVSALTDLDGNARFMDVPTIPNTGNGTPPIVDMGAYESVFVIFPSIQGGDGPGGVGTADGSSALELWLRADRGITENSSSVSNWFDQSGYSHHFDQTTATSQPVYQPNQLNSQPAIEYDGSDDFLTNANGIMATTVLGVVKTTRTINTQETFLGARSNYPDSADAYYFKLSDLPSGQLSANVFTDGDDAVIGIPRITDQFYIYSSVFGSTSIDLFVNGASQGSDLFTGNPYNIDGPTNVGAGYYADSVVDYIQGQIAEIIVYSLDLNSVERILVENYLSAKYNLALDTDSGALDVYDGDNNGNFDLDVAGIGQFGGNQHFQAHAAGMIVVNSSFLQDDGDWLLFGHSTPVNSNTTTDLPTTGDWATPPNPQRWTRHYYIDITDVGTIGGTVNITFDFSEGGMNGGSLPSAPVSNYRLLKRSGTTGQFNDIATATVVVGNQVQFQNVDVSLLGSNFTLGTLDGADSPTALTIESLIARSQGDIPGWLGGLALGILLLSAIIFLRGERTQSP